MKIWPSFRILDLEPGGLDMSRWAKTQINHEFILKIGKKTLITNIPFNFFRFFKWFQIRVLNLSFETIMNRFNDEQIEYKERAARKIADYLRKQNIEVSDEQINEAIESGSLAQLTRNVHLGEYQKKALFEDVRSRASEIMIIEKQIRDVAELFEDMHMMVTQQGKQMILEFLNGFSCVLSFFKKKIRKHQLRRISSKCSIFQRFPIAGETIERIETSVMAATDYAEKAERNVKEAVVLRRKGRKCKIVFIVVAVILVLIALLVLKIITPFVWFCMSYQFLSSIIVCIFAFLSFLFKPVLNFYQCLLIDPHKFSGSLGVFFIFFHVFFLLIFLLFQNAPGFWFPLLHVITITHVNGQSQSPSPAALSLISRELSQVICSKCSN